MSTLSHEVDLMRRESLEAGRTLVLEACPSRPWRWTWYDAPRREGYGDLVTDPSDCAPIEGGDYGMVVVGRYLADAQVPDLADPWLLGAYLSAWPAGLQRVEVTWEPVHDGYGRRVLMALTARERWIPGQEPWATRQGACVGNGCNCSEIFIH